VEIKGEGGYVILPPSRLADGRLYQRTADYPIAEAPAWLINAIRNATGRPPAAKTRGPAFLNNLPESLLKLFEQDAGLGLSSDPNDLLPPPDPAEIRAALKLIPSDDEQTWFKIGIAIWSCVHAGTFSEDEGRRLFHEWSSASAKYEERECDRKWDHCATRNGVSAGTIFHLAKQADPNWRAMHRGEGAGPGIGAPLILTSAEFVSTFTPPDYLIDGLLQRRYIYALTAPTGEGKTSVALRLAAHVAKGLQLADRDVDAGKVLFLAGENPDDVRMRWIKLCEQMRIDSNAVDVFFVSGSLALANTDLRQRIMEASKAHGPFSLVIVDTSAAYFDGKDENDNVEMMRHAKMLRGLADVIDGGPTILVTCHPVKNYSRENLLPRGGGAFLNEIDGNLVCQKTDGTMAVEIHWQGKFRGPDFAPIPFKLEVGTCERLKDSKGR
jgi:hypothetical protein